MAMINFHNWPLNPQLDACPPNAKGLARFSRASGCILDSSSDLLVC
jgi:hypothetical protein